MSSQSQQTQFTNGQRDTRATTEDLLESRKKFLSSLITRNNSNNEDLGVNKVLDLLDKDNFPKACKGNKIKKDELLTTLGFLNYLSFEAA